MSEITFSKSELLEIMLEAKDRIDPSERADFIACLLKLAEGEEPKK